jgi:hypothetical protein
MSRRTRSGQVLFGVRPPRRKLTNRRSGFASLHRPLRFEPLEDRRLLSITVNTLIDVNANDGLTTLREAVAAASSGDTINFSVTGTINLSSQGQITINKSLTINGPGASLLTIRAYNPTGAQNGDGSRIFNIDDGNALVERTVTLSGLKLTGGDAAGNGGAISSAEELIVNSSTISGNAATGNGGGISEIGVHSFTPQGHLSIINSTISGNTAVGSAVYGGRGSGIYAYDSIVTVTGSTISGNVGPSLGGGIYSGYGILNITNSTISGNSSTIRFGYGGGINSNHGSVTVSGSTISGNSAADSGGGIDSEHGNLTITSSTISGNSAGKDGGGISVYLGNLTITSSTISGNSATDSGGISLELESTQTATIVQSTISGNSAAEEDGGLSLDGGLTTIRYSTITNNSAPAGNHGGVTLESSSTGTTQLDVTSTIIAGNIGSDVDGFIEGPNTLVQSHGYNLIGSGNTIGVFNQPGDQTGANPLLGSLADNGGPTKTHALLVGSPAIDAGDPAAVAGVGNVPTFDERGAPADRVADGDGDSAARIDIGAFERQPSQLLVDTLADESDGDFTAGDFSLREAIERSNLIAEVDSIEFSATLFGGVIVLTGGELQISRAVQIIGPGAALLTIDASGNDPTPAINNGDGSRVFNIDNVNNVTNAIVQITGLTLTGGDVTGSGGGILSHENLTIVDTTIRDNSATTGGGIQGLGGNLTVTSSTISGNSANNGGGIYGQSVSLTVTDSTISGNAANSSGGGISTPYGSVRLAHSTITGNMADADHNNTGQGGGIAVFNNPYYSSVNVILDHTIVAGNIRGTSTRSDIFGPIGGARFSLIGDNTGASIVNNGGNLIGTSASPINPLLGPLADNGGPTFTHALLTGSPAIDAGDAAAVAGVSLVPLYDQRGAPFTRVFDGDGAGGARIDIGAFELQPIPAAFFGDYTQNGEVDAGDYVVWRKTLGNAVANYSGADGNGDGTIDQPDYDIWRMNFGSTVPTAGAGAGTAAGNTLTQPIASGAGSEIVAEAALAEPVAPGIALSIAGRASSDTLQAIVAVPVITRLAASALIDSDQMSFEWQNRPSFDVQPSAAFMPASSLSDDALVAWLSARSSGQHQDGGDEAVASHNDSTGDADEDMGLNALDAIFASLAV